MNNVQSRVPCTRAIAEFDPGKAVMLTVGQRTFAGKAAEGCRTPRRWREGESASGWLETSYVVSYLVERRIGSYRFILPVIGSYWFIIR
jgi:hypothetical protein